MINPTWLPSLYNFEVIKSEDWYDIEETLFSIFYHDFIERICFYESLVMIIDRSIDPRSGLERTYWKLISKRNSRDMWDRYQDFDRARRLPWCRPVIEYHSDKLNLLEWDYLENNDKVRTYIWLKNLDYIVIIEKKKEKFAILISAHYIDGEGSRNKYQTKFDHRIL
jgi:hypothetical protein